MSKIRVALIFGGQSEEHEVSIMTAREIVKAIDKEKYSISLFGIDRDGYWKSLSKLDQNIESLQFEHKNPRIPGDVIELLQNEIEIAFPLLHGPFGEDGRIQGLFEMINVKYAGCDLISSALCMDKDYSKKLLTKIGIPMTPSVTIFRDEKYEINDIIGQLGYPMFIKPVNLGSSVGISKAKNDAEFLKAIEKAFKYDSKVIIEMGIDAREIECAVLGNKSLIVSTPGEILPSHEFYDYEAKYFDDGKSQLIIPAEINEKTKREIQEYAIKAYKELGCSGLSRVDFFIDKKTNDIYMNEINTMPGFTPFSMYPLLLKSSGIDYADLIDRLIQLGLE